MLTKFTGEQTHFSNTAQPLETHLLIKAVHITVFIRHFYNTILRMFTWKLSPTEVKQPI